MEFNFSSETGLWLQAPKPLTLTVSIQQIMSQFHTSERLRVIVLQRIRGRVLRAAQTAGISTDIAMFIIEELEDEVEDALRERNKNIAALMGRSTTWSSEFDSDLSNICAEMRNRVAAGLIRQRQRLPALQRPVIWGTQAPKVPAKIVRYLGRSWAVSRKWAMFIPELCDSIGDRFYELIMGTTKER